MKNKSILKGVSLILCAGILTTAASTASAYCGCRWNPYAGVRVCHYCNYGYVYRPYYHHYYYGYGRYYHPYYYRHYYRHW